MSPRLHTLRKLTLLAIACMLGMPLAQAQGQNNPASPEALKADLLRLNRDMTVLEEDLQGPASSQVAVYLSVDQGKMFELDSVQVLIDQRLVASQIYDARALKALERGGMQRLYLGHLKTGEHTLVAFFTGKAPHERDSKRAARLTFRKDQTARTIELKVKDGKNLLEPEFEVKLWP